MKTLMQQHDEMEYQFRRMRAIRTAGFMFIAWLALGMNLLLTGLFGVSPYVLPALATAGLLWGLFLVKKYP